MVNKIEEALEDIRQGKMVILVDDEDRENEGDLTMAAEKVTPEAINFMAKYGRGLICLSLTEERLNELRLPMMVSDNTSRFQTAFTVSVDARKGVTTGISAADRATTILTAIDDRRPARRSGLPGPYFSSEGATGRGPGPDRPDGGVCRSREAGRAETCRGDLRDHERGRDDGTDAGP